MLLLNMAANRLIKFPRGLCGICSGGKDMGVEIYGGEERVLEAGCYHGFAYVIKSLGSHPVAYVAIDIPL